MGFVSRVLSVFRQKHGEGQYRDGPWLLPWSGGWLPADVGRFINWWQNGHDIQQGGGSAMVEACVSAYSQTVAMCPGSHWRWTPEKGRERVVNSALTRVLRKPNAYQTISDFLLNATRSLYEDGNAYALAIRNNRFEIAELHLMRPRESYAVVATTGDVFYHLSGNEVIDRQIEGEIFAPARDVLHIRLHTPRHSLVGESPLAAASLPLAAGNAALQQQVQFFLNQSRPSFVLTTEQKLTAEQVNELRDRWNEQSKGLNQGGTPILTSGLQPKEMGQNAKDSQLAELLKLGDQAIANVFRTPGEVVGLGGNNFASTEALMNFWLASGLGFALNHIEEAFGILFGLAGQPDEYLEFDTGALLRSNFKDRVEGYARGVQTAIFAPNEARAEFELPPDPNGNEPRVQQQVVPLSFTEPSPPPPPPPPNPKEIAEEAVKMILPPLEGVIVPLSERVAALEEMAQAPISAEDVEQIAVKAAQMVTEALPPLIAKALPPPEPAESPPPGEDAIAAFAGMALFKEMEDAAEIIDLGPAPVPAVVRAPQITVNVDNHIPRRRAERTVVTDHDESGRIKAYERHEIGEE